MRDRFGETRGLSDRASVLLGQGNATRHQFQLSRPYRENDATAGPKHVRKEKTEPLHCRNGKTNLSSNN